MDPIVEYTNYKPGYAGDVSSNGADLQYRLRFPAHVTDHEHERISKALEELENIVEEFRNEHAFDLLGTKEYPAD